MVEFSIGSAGGGHRRRTGAARRTCGRVGFARWSMGRGTSTCSARGASSAEIPHTPSRWCDVHDTTAWCRVLIRVPAVRPNGCGFMRFPVATMTPCVVCARPCAGPRCRRCEAEHQQRRNAARGDRYGAAHQAERRRWDPIVKRGGVQCARCGELIAPTAAWDLDHLERIDPITGLKIHVRSHPSHARHNRGARSNRQ